MKKTVDIMIFNPFFAFYNKTLPAGNSYVMSNNLKSNHQRCSVKKLFLEISQNSQENTCTRVSFLIKLQV